MQIRNGSNLQFFTQGKPSRFRFLIPAALLVIASAGLVESFQSTQSAAGDSIVATYSSGVLSATIPYHAPHAGAGELTVEVLDPEDGVLGRAQQTVSVRDGKGRWLETLKLKSAVAVEDLAWHRLRYHFSYDGQKTAALQGTESISQILIMPAIHILGQQSYISGVPAAVRVVVTDSKNNPVAGASSLRIDLVGSNAKPVSLFSGRLNRRGTTEAQFQFPAGSLGVYQLRYAVETPIGSTEYAQQVRLEDKASILLTTEKPIYQPGQTIHARALALDRGDNEATSNRGLTFEVEDSRGNKVFKKVTQTDPYGIASAEFRLADEVNLGTYHLRALMNAPNGLHANNAEIALNVERYVLPKFKVAVEFGEKDSKAKRGYRPGDHVTGTVRANYFFGKPVDAGEITVKASGMDVAQFEAGLAHGKTDGDGAYHFDLTLPAYFAGRPLSQGVARVLVEATVKDSAGHAETRGEPITVSESPLIITAIPEGGTLIPNLENQVFVVTSYADGTPARTSIAANLSGKAVETVATDEGGVAVIRIKADNGADRLRVDATDKDGNHAVTTVQLQSRQGADQILLRTERAVYRAGDRIQLHVFSTKERGSAYVDIVKDGQTILTRDLDIANGQAELTLAATPQMAGTLDCNAYVFGGDARPVSDHRLVFVQPADELKIETAVAAPVYKPGDDARISFRVTNSRGEGVQAALGLQVVDEAVFALAEKQPGFAKVFFYLEQEAMKPRVEIHSIGMPGIVEASSNGERENLAARALFAATEVVSTNKFETEVGRTVPQTKYWEYIQRYHARFQAQVSQLGEKLTHAYTNTGNGIDLTRLAAPVVPDAWDTNLRIEHAQWDAQRLYTVRSAGPDKRFDTADDMVGYLQVSVRRLAGPSDTVQRAGTIGVKIEHDRGPFNGLAEIAGSVEDETETAIADASIRVRSVSTGKTRTARPDAAGRFDLAGLAPGDYEVALSSPGFSDVSQKLTLKIRDRAVLSITLGMLAAREFQVARTLRNFGQPLGKLGPPMKESVFVTATAANVGFGRGGGVGAGMGGGIAGGVLGGVPSASPHVRSYFPEALYINPEIITDQDGRASISIPLADNITTWRMAMLASTAHGALGSGTSSIKVFQDFFVDLDMPVTVTQGDRVSIPVAAYNYSGAAGNVNLQLQSSDWYSLIDDVPEKTVAVDTGRVGGSQFTIEAQRIGKFKLTLSAKLAGGVNRADIVVRDIEVVPNGREQNTVFNGHLDTAVEHQVNFPAAAIPGA
jgi:Alpha-2-macroglobulin family/Carboxypeptidase regulatory-like domain/MG2 domain/Alpha-2-macroglobulin bait region domain